MDRTDARLVRFFTSPDGFGSDLRPSYAAAAAAAGVTQDVARARLKRMTETGFLGGLDVMVNPAVLGMDLVRFEMPVPDGEAKRSLLHQVADLEGALLTIDYQTKGLVHIMYVPIGGTARVARLLGGLGDCDVESRRVFVHTGGQMPRGGWALLHALQGDTRQSLERIAERLGVTPRTARRRMEALVASRAAFVLARADFGRLTSGIPFEMRMVPKATDDPDALRQVLNDLDGTLFLNADGEEWVVAIVAPNAAAASQVRDRIADATTAHVRMDLIRDHIVHDTWLREELGRRATNDA